MATSSTSLFPNTANGTKELLNTLTILQDKLAQCQDEKNDVLRKMSTKKALLKESQFILQKDLKEALYENANEKRKIQLNNDRKTDSNDDVLIELVDCQGWVYDKDKIWIQARGRVMIQRLHDDKKVVVSVTQARLSCLPNKFLPETVHYNTAAITAPKDNSDDLLSFYIQFTLLPDISLYDLTNNLRIACQYQLSEGPQQSSFGRISESYSVEWRFNTANDAPLLIQRHNLEMISKVPKKNVIFDFFSDYIWCSSKNYEENGIFLNTNNHPLGTNPMLLTSNEALRVYFSHYLKIKVIRPTFIRFIKTFCTQLSDSIFSNEDASLLLVCNSANDHIFDLFGLSRNVILGMLHKCTLKENADEGNVGMNSCCNRFSSIFSRLFLRW
ncbi:hypothetical protein BDF20DRAFT_288859 [Mycotypha africana]|uniref:uncharacterized protein n=1 Tax=Mycotypha africana TaxID=64632 RepID=UPI0023000F06|nr:uncharacterized protein BDF20DRAFT_288859 [Mycotypha africana]KAI8987778.1 hypothetical protein BDF20DRAFT_288859 [Mycotypha africana]